MLVGIALELFSTQRSTFLIQLPAEPASYARPLPGLVRTPEPSPNWLSQLSS